MTPGSARPLPAPVQRDVDRYLAVADRLLPGRVVGFHVVGSVALGAYRRGRSDVDFIALVDRRLDAAELRRLRAVHVITALRTGAGEVLRRGFAVPGVCNGAFVVADDASLPVTKIDPVASHSGHDFHVGSAFDVNPVVWRTWAEHGIAVRGPDAATLGVDPEPAAFVAFNRQNLDSYWKRTAEGLLRRGGRSVRTRLSPRWLSAWCALGPPRLHHSIAKDGVISKEAAGEYALDTFGAAWHPLLREALAYWREEPPPDDRFRDPAVRAGVAAEFVLAVVEDARRLP